MINKFFNWINGNKTTIGATASMVVNSDYVEEIVTNPSLYTLFQGLAGLLFTVGLTHKVGKAVKS